MKNLYNVIDNDGDAFKDTLTILKKVDLVISTDTSLTHIAATANVKCWALLTTGCDWRWITDNINNTSYTIDSLKKSYIRDKKIEYKMIIKKKII